MYIHMYSCWRRRKRGASMAVVARGEASRGVLEVEGEEGAGEGGDHALSV
jgi:hypothetical protein